MLRKSLAGVFVQVQREVGGVFPGQRPALGSGGGPVWYYTCNKQLDGSKVSLYRPAMCPRADDAPSHAESLSIACPFSA